MHSEPLQHDRDTSLGIPQGFPPLPGDLNKFFTKATIALQRTQFMSNTGDELLIPPQVDSASTLSAAKAQTPITVMSLTTIILSEISLMTKGA